MDAEIAKVWQEFEQGLGPGWKYSGTNKWKNRVYFNHLSGMFKVAAVDATSEDIYYLPVHQMPVTQIPANVTYQILSQDYTFEFVKQTTLASSIHDVFNNLTQEPLPPYKMVVTGNKVYSQSINSEWVEMGAITNNSIELEANTFVTGNNTQADVKADIQKMMDALKPQPMSQEEFEKKLHTLQEEKKKLQDATAAKWGIKSEKKDPPEKYVSEVGVTYIEAIEAYKIVQYVDNKMYEALITKNVRDFSHNVLAHEQGWGTAFHHVVATYVSVQREKSSAITSGPAFANKEGMRKKVKNPVTKKGEGSIYQMIQILNDNHGWTREQIADWLDTLDEQPVFHPVEQTGVPSTARVVTLEPAFYKKGDEDKPK